MLAVTLYDLLLAFRRMWSNGLNNLADVELDREEFSVEQMMGFLLEKISRRPGQASH